ncbi:hypothetical protein HC928_03200 [bacterium]|nr:hypothetical protein [bacterium]
MYKASPHTIDALYQEAHKQVKDVPVEQYDRWITEGLPAHLQQSNTPEERNMGRWIALVLDPFFDARSS